MTATAVSWTSEGPEDAPVVLLSSSLGATRGMWDPQVPVLAERYRVITYDTRGHGDSPSPDGAWSLDDLVDDVVALLDELGAPRAHVVGLSLGGMTAMRLAARSSLAARAWRVPAFLIACASSRIARCQWRSRSQPSRVSMP